MQAAGQGRNCHNWRTHRRPQSTDLWSRGERVPACSVRESQSTVISCDTFTTESRGKPESRAGNRTFPGAPASARLLVMTATMTVWIRLWLNASAWTTRTGRRKPGSDRRGSGRSAHQISPRRSSADTITRNLCPEHGTVPLQAEHPTWRIAGSTLHSVAW